MNKDPVNDIMRPKKGMHRATTRVESTSPVLIKIEYRRDLSDGTSSYRLIATGDKVNANLVNGLTTVVHTAIFEATKS